MISTIGTMSVIATRMYPGMAGRASGLARAESVTGHIYRTLGVQEILGTGELDIDVKFPVKYTEFPSPSGGGFLAEGEPLVTGSYPTWDVGFASFTYDLRPGGIRLYTGGRLIVVVTGPADKEADMHSFASWQVEGTTLVNPAAPTL